MIRILPFGIIGLGWGGLFLIGLAMMHIKPGGHGYSPEQVVALCLGVFLFGAAVYYLVGAVLKIGTPPSKENSLSLTRNLLWRSIEGVLVVCAAVTLFGLVIRSLLPVSPEEKAIADLTRFVPKARLIWSGRQLAAIVFNNTGVADDNICYFSGISIQQLVFINEENLSDRGLESLCDVEDLSALTFLFCPRITDRGLNSISKLGKLESLVIASNSHISDEGVRCFETLLNLKHLTLSHTEVTGKGLERLVKLEELELLDLGSTPLTDEALKYIGKMHALRRLTLNSTQITDMGLEYLRGLTNLEHLNIDDTRVTWAGVARLQSQLPSTNVNFIREKR